MTLTKSNDLLLYSTCTQLAYEINRKYYNDVHYVWCTDAFDSNLQPGTSNPKTICNRLLKQIVSQDAHATEINQNKAGILKGAKFKYEDGVISKDQYEEIKAKVALSELRDYYPIIYLINKRKVKKRLQVVPPVDTASKNSVEYIIDDLKSNECEIIRVKDILWDIVTID